MTEYDHDRMTLDDLALLGVVLGGAHDREDLLQEERKDPAASIQHDPGQAAETPALSDSTRNESTLQQDLGATTRDRATSPHHGQEPPPLEPELHVPSEDSVGASACSWAPLDDSLPAVQGVSMDAMDWGNTENSLWDTQVPDVLESAEQADGEEVPAEYRATQLAQRFLIECDALDQRNLDLLADIIAQRGWSSVQRQVRGLVEVGYSIEQVHRIFRLTDTWMQFAMTRAVVPVGWYDSVRLTWSRAAQLMGYLGYDCEQDEVVEFLERERAIWLHQRHGYGPLAAFSEYLFNYRLSCACEVGNGVRQTNLDPHDDRAFDGTRNELYSDEWWDEPTGDQRSTLDHLLACGHSLDDALYQLGMSFGDIFE